MAYYFAVAALPPISLGVKPDMSFKEVKEMLALNLSKADMDLIALLVRPIDLYNLRAHWLGIPLEEWDDKGNYSPKEFEEALLVSDRLPEYLVDYLLKHESTEERLRYFSALYVALYQDAVKNEFLKKYFRLEREIRLVLAALRAKALGRDLMREFQFEDPHDSLVAQILAQKDSPEYMPPREYEDLKAIFGDNITDPQKQHLAILQYRFAKIEELEEGSVFSIDQILGYLARLILVEDWQKLDREKGQTILEQLSEHG